MPHSAEATGGVARRSSRVLALLRGASIALLFCVGFVVAFEASAQLLLPDLVADARARAFGDRRVAFISPEAFENKTGYYAFRPSSSVREVAYYPDAQGSFTLEYDCTFASDRMGFPSNAIAYEQSEVLLLGDSYAQGSGGCAWLPGLADDVRNRIYSAAMLGTGVKHWRNILADLERIRKPAKILVVFITHDFYRPDWVFPEQQLACLAQRGDCTGQFWYPVSDASAAISAERYALRTPQLGKSGMSKLLRYHLTASFTLFERFKRRTESDSQSLQDSLAIVAELAARYPLKLIWVNEKSEVETPEPRTQRLWDRLAALDVTRCTIPKEGFLERDGHPNARGYSVLKACVERVVRTW
jgi:hypothetical protein